MRSRSLSNSSASDPALFNSVLFLVGFLLLGFLFGLQEWHLSRSFGMRANLWILLKAWGAQYLLWGVLCLAFWRLLGKWLVQAKLWRIVLVSVPVGLMLALIEEMIWVLLFPRAPMGLPQMPYWQRLRFHLFSEPVGDLVIFWSSLLFFRALAYSQQLREKEVRAAQLDAQLSGARMQALRMQLNPHFLFNTMNGISSLMRTDISAADTMLEQLSSLLRITLERGDAQLIPLSDELNFIGLYMSMQNSRFADRVCQKVLVRPDLLDALVPAMILQPIVENAYKHGLTRIHTGGTLSIEGERHGSDIQLRVRNSGVGLLGGPATSNGGMGLTNVRKRLQLHYGEQQGLDLFEEGASVVVSITLPFQTSDRLTATLSGT